MLRPALPCLILAVALVGCASQKNLATGLAYPAEVAVIRSAVGEEKRQQRSFNPLKTNYWAFLNSIRDHETRELNLLSGNLAVRVKPGKYEVRASCQAGGAVLIIIPFLLEIDAKAGKTYLLECVGGNRNQDLEIREVDSAMVKPVEEL